MRRSHSASRFAALPGESGVWKRDSARLAAEEKSWDASAHPGAEEAADFPSQEDSSSAAESAWAPDSAAETSGPTGGSGEGGGVGSAEPESSARGVRLLVCIRETAERIVGRRRGGDDDPGLTGSERARRYVFER